MRRRTALIAPLLAIATFASAQLPWIRLMNRGVPDGYGWTFQWSDGSPVRHARVLRMLEFERSGFSDLATTNNEGYVEFSHAKAAEKLLGQPYRIQVVAQGPQGVSCATVDSGKRGGVVKLRATTNLRLRLVDAKGAPAPGVRAVAQYLWIGERSVGLYSFDERSTGATSDGQGICEFPALPGGTCMTVSIEDERFARPDWNGRIILGEGSKTEATLTLLPGAVLEGTAIDAQSGQPISKVVVIASTRTGGSAASNPTGADGKYKIVGLRPGLYSVQAQRGRSSGDARVGTLVSGLSLADGEHKSGVDVKFIQGVRLIGKVTYRNTGRPSARVQIGATNRDGVVGGGFTNADGTFEMVVPPGKYDVYAIPANRHVVEHEYTVEVEAVKDPIKLDLVLPVEPFARPLLGVVLAADGSPAAKAQVVTDGESAAFVAECDASGRFEIPPSVLAPATLRARRGSDCSGPLLVTTADEPLTLRLAPNGLATVEGKVADAKGTPLAKAEILFFEVGSHPLFARLETDGQGRYFIPKVWPNTSYVLFAKKSGYGEQSQQQVEVRPGEKKRLETLKLPNLDRTVVGRVLNDDGDPVAGVVVTAGGGQDAKMAVSDTAGRFKLERVPREELHLHAELRNLDGWKSVAADSDGEVIIIVKAPPRAAVQVPKEDLTSLVGKPAPSLFVRQWLNGGTLDLAKHRGKLIVLNFWGTT